MGCLPERGPPLYALADSTGLERDWAAESERARQVLELLPDHDAYLGRLHAAQGMH